MTEGEIRIRDDEASQIQHNLEAGDKKTLIAGAALIAASVVFPVVGIVGAGLFAAGWINAIRHGTNPPKGERSA